MDERVKLKKRRRAGPSPLTITNSVRAEAFEHWSGDPSFMHSFARAWIVLNFVVSNSHGPAAANAVAEATGLSIQTVRRCFYTLKALDCIQVTPQGALPGPAIAGLAAAYAAGSPLLAHGSKVVEDLRDQLGLQVALAVFEGGEPIFPKTAYAGAAVRFSYREPLSAYTSAAGKLFLAHLTAAQLDRYIEAHPFAPRTEHSISTLSELHDALAEVRRRGYAISDQEMELGVRSAGVPISDPRDKVVGSISVTTMTAAVGLRRLRSEIIPVLKQAAAALRFLLP